MNTEEEIRDNIHEEEEMPAQEIIQDRDVLMMEKPLSDNRAAGYKPADKKLLRNITIIVLFLIGLLIVLMVIVNSSNQGAGTEEGTGPSTITRGSE
jgi:hypothetical protein